MEQDDSSVSSLSSVIPTAEKITAEKTGERGNWAGRFDFILSAVGYAVGLGNVWRFPYLCYENGGASFLFPYIIMLIIAGIPLFFLELSIGQFSSEGPITAWKMAPAFMGIGYAMVIISAVVSIYYNMIIAYAIYYMLVSLVYLDGGLPWESCGHAWNTEDCRYDALPRIENLNTTAATTALWDVLYNKTCVECFIDDTTSDFTSNNATFFEKWTVDLANSSLTPERISKFALFKGCRMTYTSPTEEYYNNFILNEGGTTSLNDLGSISGKLTISLLIAWLLIFGCLIKGIKSSGKVVYFTATFPYVILIILFFKGISLEGAEMGLEFYTVPDWDKLKDVTIWGKAATQIFYSLGVGFGGLLTMASYNKFNNNVFRDALMVSTINCGTSIFAGFAIFSLLGHMAFVTNQDITKVAASGQGLAFIAYPDGISRLPGSPVWAFLFFFMILTLGMDSQFGMMETVLTGIVDIFPRYLRKHKACFTLVVCSIGFVLGIPMCLQGGGRVLSLMNNYSGSYNLMIVALFEIIALCFVYGVKNFRMDIEMMLGEKSFSWWLYWLVCWVIVTPIAVLFIVIVSASQYVPSTYNGVQIEGWAEGIGWLMVVAPLAAMVFVMGWQMVKLGPRRAFRPADMWGPARPENHVERYNHLAAFDGDIDQGPNSNALAEFDIKIVIEEKVLPANGNHQDARAPPYTGAWTGGAHNGGASAHNGGASATAFDNMVVSERL